MTLKTRLDSLQVLRAVAAFAVMFTHIPMFGYGAFGVDIFFIVSGFIICYVTSINADNFLIKRLFRVLPLYYFGTVVIFAISLMLPELLNKADPQWQSLGKSLLFIPYLNANMEVAPVLKLGWTLNYEMFFYAIFALALKFSKKHSALISVLILTCVVLLGRIVESDNVLFNFYTDTILLEFCFGIIIFQVWQKIGCINLSTTKSYLALCLAIAIYIAMFFIEGQELRVLYWGGPAIILFSVMLFFTGNIIFPVWLIILGDASYSLYLFHPYIVFGVDRVIFEMKELTISSAFVAIVVLFLCCIMAVISYYLLEKNSNRWLRNRFIKAKK